MISFLGQQLQLSKHKLEEVKKCLQFLGSHNPASMCDDPKLLVSLLPSIINMGGLDGDGLSQLNLSDELLEGNVTTITCNHNIHKYFPGYFTSVYVN